MRWFQILAVFILAAQMASLGGLPACAQDDIFPPTEEEIRRRQLPEEFKDVVAKWSYDDEGKIVGVNFCEGGGNRSLPQEGCAQKILRTCQNSSI